MQSVYSPTTEEIREIIRKKTDLLDLFGKETAIRVQNLPSKVTRFLAAEE